MVDQKVLNAAHQLEDIAVIAKAMCNDLREGADNPYGRVYWLRKQMSYLVATLGEGVPSGLQAIEKHYEREVSRND